MIVANFKIDIEMSSVFSVQDDNNFLQILSSDATKLVIVDFSANWCPSCRRMEPVFKFLADKYPLASFLVLDVDKCPNTAMKEHVNALPCFIFYQNGIRLDMLEGSDPIALEAKVKEHYNKCRKDSDASGHIKLNDFLIANEVECLNESNNNTVKNILQDDDTNLKSDCDSQLIISFSFTQPVRLHSLIVKAPLDTGPKDMKIFINQPQTLDFENAERNMPVQSLSLLPSDLEGSLINLKYVKFQNVTNLQLYVQNNQSGGETTVIKYLEFIGSVSSTTTINDFTKLAKKKSDLN